MSLAVLFLLLGAACSARSPATATVRPVSVVTLSTATETQTATDTPPPAPSPDPTQTPQPVILAPTFTSAPVFHMCSPLAWETIPELWEIVSNPFNWLGPGREDGHHGVDFAHYRRKGHLDMVGEEIDSVLPGRVAASIQDRLPYGNMVIVETPYTDIPPEIAATINLASSGSLYLLYAHMLKSPQVALGEKVDCGQPLGQVGMSGLDIINEHLHLETRLGPPAVTFESMAYYDTNASQAEMSAYVRWRTGGEFQPFDPMKLFAAYLTSLGQPVPTLAPAVVSTSAPSSSP